MATRKHNHYFRRVSGLEYVDVYRVLHLFNVTDPCIQHAVKKLLVAGGRGAGKDISRDIREAIDSLARWQEMRDEESTGDNSADATSCGVTTQDVDYASGLTLDMLGKAVGVHRLLSETDLAYRSRILHALLASTEGSNTPQGQPATHNDSARAFKRAVFLSGCKSIREEIRGVFDVVYYVPGEYVERVTTLAKQYLPPSCTCEVRAE